MRRSTIRATLMSLILVFVGLLSVVLVLRGVGAVHAFQVRQIAQLNVAFVVEKVVVGGGHVYGPAELFAMRLAVDFLDGHIVLLAPGDADARIQVVELGGAQRNILVLLFVGYLHF